MPDPDPIAAALRKAPVNDAVRASAWDVFHDASDQDDLEKRLRGISIPDNVKADLWDLKAGRASVAPPAPQPVAGDTFADKIANAAAALGHGVVGFAKGAAHTALNAVDAGMNAGVIPGAVPGMSHPGVDYLRDASAANGTAEKIGAGAETVAELAQPGYEAGKLAVMGGRALATKAAPLATAAATAIRSVDPLVLDAASEVAGHAIGAPFGSSALARRALAFAIKAARKSAPDAAETANAGGKLVLAQTPTLAESLTDALASTRAETPMPRVTTPPQAELPAGYTPRTTVPKPRVAPKAAPAAAPEPPKRAYFLKSEADLAPAEASPAPTGTIDPAALPASWQKHIGQDLFPLTGKEGEEVAAALADELRTSGMSVGQAMMAVSKNADIPTQFRQQILKSLSRVNLKGAK